jgi:hypothetical protein
MVVLNKELCTATSPDHMSYVCGPRSENKKKNNANNIGVTTVMVIRRIKDMCGQVISVRYPDKENHDR